TVGTRVTTILPGQQLESVIREVEPPSTALIELDIAGAKLHFRWSFTELDAERSRITQGLGLSGTGAAAMLDQARILEQTVQAGMKRIVERIEEAWKESGPHGR